jgi:hypothetical protein
MHDDSFDHQYTDTQKLLDFGFDNFSITPVSDLEKSQEVLTESPMFTRYNSLLSTIDSPIVTDKNGYLILPKIASLKDAKREVTFYDSASPGTGASGQTASGDTVIGKISYTYDGKYVGGADILYDNSIKPALYKQEPEKNNPTTSPGNDTAASPSKERSLRPVIIGGIVGLFVLITGLYFVLVERPRLKRKSAYYRKKARRKKFGNNNDDDFLDLL